jgi:hypothetical protein
MANVVYDNFYLSNEVEDQFNSHLDLMRFCTVDTTLEGTDGMKRMINVYTATDGTEKLAQGEGNSKSIEVGHTQREYVIQLAQNRFNWFDEEAMKDPMLVPVGMQHAGTDMFNTVNGDLFGELEKATLHVDVNAYNFDAFADAVAQLELPENEEVEVFAFVNRKAKADLRKTLKDDLKYVEAFARHGYIGTVCGVNLYDKKDAKDNEIVVATRKAVTGFIRTGTEVELYTKGSRAAEDANIRKNTAISRKYYVMALTNETQATKIIKTA